MTGEADPQDLQIPHFELAWLERGFVDPATGQLLQFDGLFARKP